MGKLSNTLLMLKMLQGGRKYSTLELADIIEVSSRQIRTYKNELEKSGIYIRSIRGRYGGYIYDSKEALKNVYFDIQEINLLENISLHLNKNKMKKVDKIQLELLIEKLRYIVLYTKNNKKHNNEKWKKFIEYYQKLLIKKKPLFSLLIKKVNKTKKGKSNLGLYT